MQALLEVKKGEKPYKTAVSEWMRDEDGAVIFKVISKKRLDRQIELVCYTQRSDAMKRVIQHISFAEKDFWGIMDALESAMKQFFPDIKFDVQNVDMNDHETYHIVKNTNLNRWKLRLFSWIGCKLNSLKILIRKN